ARKLPEIQPADSRPAPRQIGVVGAGIMGAGIAQLAALKGFPVAVQEINEKALAAGTQRIAGLFAQAVEKRIVTAETSRKALSSIRPTTNWDGFADADIVVEAVVEELQIKQKVF